MNDLFLSKTMNNLLQFKKPHKNEVVNSEPKNEEETTSRPSLKTLVPFWAFLALVSVSIGLYHQSSCKTNDEIISQNPLKKFHNNYNSELYIVSSSTDKIRHLVSEVEIDVSNTTSFSVGEESVEPPVETPYNNEDPDSYESGEQLPPPRRSHKRLHPLSRSDYIGFFLATLGLIIAGGGGIGGGGILVPIYILILEFSPKHAIPLSNVTVLGGAVANTILNQRKRHPLANRPLVDWDLILIMEPLTIGGALIGAFINKLVPDYILVLLLVALLSFTAYNTLKKAMKMYKKESKEILRRKLSEKGSELSHMSRSDNDENLGEEHAALLSSDYDEEGDGGQIGSSAVPEINKGLAKILKEEETAPMGNIYALGAMFVVVLFINIMKGGGAFPSPLGIKCGSPSFWMANLFMLLWILIITMFARNYLTNRYELKKQVGFQYVEGDIKWDSHATLVYPLVCALAGFFAGMFGIGGGIVKGPLMLAMGVHPAVSSASSACMILFTSFTATTSYMVFGLLEPDYAPVVFLMGFSATCVGQLGLNYLMQKFNRNSLIAFSIGFVVLLSAFLMTIQSLISLSEGPKAHSGGICGSGH